MTRSSDLGAPKPVEAVRIVCVRDHLNPSGGTDEIGRLVGGLDRKRIDLTLIVLATRTSVSDEVEASGVALHHIARKTDIFARLRACKPHHLLLSGPKSQIWGGLAARLLGLPTTIYFNHMLPMGWMTHAVQRGLLRRCDRAIGNSQSVKAWITERYGLLPEQIEVIPSGIAVDKFDKAEPAGCDGSPVIALIGRVSLHEKGQHLMLEAMPAVLASYPNAVLLIVGDGPDLAALGRLVEQSGLTHSVRLLGYRRDIAALIKAADLVVAPSLCREGFPLVALEAAAAGRPCVAFASGGLVEAVQDGTTGFLVPTGDVDGLAKAILRVLGDPELAAKMSVAGAAFAQFFTTERQVAAITTNLERVIGQAAA